MNKQRISNKQQVFVDHYLTCWNATESARQAGYSEKFLNTNASKILQRPGVKEAIDSMLSAHSVLGLPVASERIASDKVYFVQAENGLIKIGVTSDVYRRFGYLNTASPIELRLLFWIDTTEARKLENSFHDIFKPKRVRGEWFKLSAEDVAWIKGNYGVVE